MVRLSNVRSRGGLTACAVFALTAATPAMALDKKADERTRLKACEKQLCMIVLKKEAGDDLACKIGKTWQKSKIVDGVRQAKITWSFGDAHCAVDVKVSRAAIIGAMTKPAADVELGKHTVLCDIERSEGMTKVTVDAAPKMSFKAGKVDKIWLNISKIDAPNLMKGAIWTAAKLEANFGIFHGKMKQEINELLHEKCAERYGS